MFAAAAALPVLPRWTAVTPPWLRLQRPITPAVFRQSYVPATIDNEYELATPNPRAAPAQPLSRRIDLLPWLIPLIWFVGAATLLTRFAIGLRGLRRLRNA